MALATLILGILVMIGLPTMIHKLIALDVTPEMWRDPHIRMMHGCGMFIVCSISCFLGGMGIWSGVTHL